MSKLFLASAAVVFSNNVFGAVIIQNNFDGVADDVGPAFQTLSNSVGGAGTFDPTTGVVTNPAENTNATGFNNVALVTAIPAGTTEFTVTFAVSSVVNFGSVQSNGFFLGLVTGADATGTAGSALFNNNDAASMGLNLDDGDDRVLTEGLSGGASVLANVADPTVASIADGFTFTLTLRDDNTLDASSTGLINDIAIVGATIDPTEDASFANFLSGGIGINATAQGNSLSFTVDSVTLSAVPEPSISVLVGLVSGLALFGRRRCS